MLYARQSGRKIYDTLETKSEINLICQADDLSNHMIIEDNDHRRNYLQFRKRDRVEDFFRRGKIIFTCVFKFMESHVNCELKDDYQVNI